MDELDDFVNKLESKTNDAQEALKTIQENMTKQEKDKKPVVMGGIQPMTRLRGSIEEAKSAQENPEIQKIIDSFNDLG